MGALSVVICAVLSRVFLKETLTLFGWLGCALCILGSIIIGPSRAYKFCHTKLNEASALNGPTHASAATIPEFKKLFLAPGFLVFGSAMIITAIVLIFFFVPRFGKTHMLVSSCASIRQCRCRLTTFRGSYINLLLDRRTQCDMHIGVGRCHFDNNQRR